LLTLHHAEKTCQVLHVLVRLDDPWLSTPSDGPLVTRTITPSLVARVVSLALEAGWAPEQPGTTLEFVLVDDARLVPLADWS
jgi:hypothetical protein